jgi:hypothetical protein
MATELNNNELYSVCKERLLITSRHLSGRAEKKHENLGQVSRPSGGDSKQQQTFLRAQGTRIILAFQMFISLPVILDQATVQLGSWQGQYVKG